MTDYIIIGAGSFGLNTALELRKNEPKAKITIYDKNLYLSSSIKSGNGLVKYENTSNFSTGFTIFKKICFTKYKNLYYIAKINSNIVNWYLIYLFYNFKNYNNDNNLIIKILNDKNLNDTTLNDTTNNENLNDKKINKCENSEHHNINYWDDIIKKCKDNNIFINNNVEIINYNHKDNKIYVETNQNKIYNCDKLILCTANDLNLIKNHNYHNYLNTISGIIIWAKVKNIKKCYTKFNHLILVPYKDNILKISLLQELCVEPKYNNQYIEKDTEDYNKIVEYLNSNKDIKDIGIISIETIWYGVRAVSYDNIPFFTEIDKNIYWFSGGSFKGTYLAQPFSKWFINYILYDKIDKTYLDPTINRLYKIKLQCYIIYIIFILVIILCYKGVKKYF
jgi:hypothetical protein